MKGRTAILGVSVTMASYLISRAINLSVTVVLARSLGPTHMGTLAFALLAVEIFDFLRDFGLRETLIYDRTEDPRLRVSAFAMILGVGLLQAVALLVFAPFANGLVEDPEIVPLLMVLALLFPINALGSVQDALLQRGFRFTALGIAEILGVGTKALVALALISYGAGIWSIVIGMLFGAALRVAILWIASDWRPTHASPTWEKARELFRYGRHIIASSIVNVIQMRADQMIVVSMVSETALGLYYVAARIPEIVILGVNGVITKVVFPAYSNLSGEPERLLAAYRTTVAASMTLIAPISLGLAASSALVVEVVFGPEWAAATPVLVFLVLSGIPSTIGWSSGDVFKATGKPQYQWILMTIESATIVPALAVTGTITGNITWIAAVMFAGEFLAATIRLATLSRVCHIPVPAAIGASVRPLASALIMAATVYFFISANPLSLPPGALLTATIALGALSYAAALFLIDRKNLAFWYQAVFKDRA